MGLKAFRNLISWVLILCFFCSSSVGAITIPTPLIDERLFKDLERSIPNITPPANTKKYLVQDTFTGAREQLKPIADYFLAQPWYYWSCQTLNGTATRSLTTIFDFKFGESFTDPLNREGALNSVRGLTDSTGQPLTGNATLHDVLAAPQVSSDLLKAVQAAFPDIKGDEWYVPNVGLAVMMGIIGGRPNPDGEGLIFAGDDYVTRAEWMVMINKLDSLEYYLYDVGQKGMNETSKDGVVPEGTWFLSDYNLVVGSQGTLFDFYTLDELSQPISRAEAAFVFWRSANSTLVNMRTGFDYYNPLKYKGIFPDINCLEINVIMGDPANLGTPSAISNIRKELNGLTVTERLAAAETGEMDFPYTFYEDIIDMYLAKGIMGGFPDGNIYPFKQLTRAEALALLFKASTLWANEFLDSFD